jgi:hypothetical protein
MGFLQRPSSTTASPSDRRAGVKPFLTHTCHGNLDTQNTLYTLVISTHTRREKLIFLGGSVGICTKAKETCAARSRPIDRTTSRCHSNAAVEAVKRRSSGQLCWHCAHGCRTEKPLYGWVCANCAYEFDRYFIILGFVRGNIDIVSAFFYAKAHGQLPPPGPRGRGVNVRKPWVLPGL